MKRLKLVNICFFILLIIVSCSTKDEPTTNRNEEQIIQNNVSEIQDSTQKEEIRAERFKVGWNTPFLTPVGSDITKVIRAYYMVGDYETMLKFVAFPKCFSKAEIIHKLRKSSWGYEIKITNLEWNQDSSFIMTIKTSKQHTVGSEQYFGRIINDTAKLVLFPEKEDLFPYYGDENLDDPCE